MPKDRSREEGIGTSRVPTAYRKQIDADGALVLLTAALVLVTLLSVVVAVSAKKSAKEAVKQAQAANAIAANANEISTESNQIAQEATTFAKGVATDLAWDEAVAAVAAIQAFDAAGHEPISDRMALIRIRLMLLIDRLDWDGFDNWIARELQCISILARDASAKGSAAGSARRDPDVALRLNANLLIWVAKFTINLRIVRKTGRDERALAFLTKEATKPPKTNNPNLRSKVQAIPCPETSHCSGGRI